MMTVPFRPGAARRAIGVAAIAALLAAIPAAAPAAAFYRTLHVFGQSFDGINPRSDLVADTSGRLYGTTNGGGQFGEGTLYRLTLAKTPNGAPKYELLHSFQQIEGSVPEGGVLIGADGGLYGSTNAGGAFNAGTVYRVDPTTFALTKLHDFNPNVKDGTSAVGGLTAGPNGLLYGTTGSGGQFGYGTAFAISPKGDTVAYAVIHNFGGQALDDGDDPYLGRLLSSGTHLYGTTIFGSTLGFGVAFELTLTASGWNESIIHRFASVTNDVFNPANGLIRDKTGALYGCAGGAQYGRGAVYALQPAGGGWNEVAIKVFGPNTTDPFANECSVVLSAGRLIGTSGGGGQNGAGTVFTVTSGSVLAVAHSFGPTSSANPWEPDNALTAVGNGYYVGATVNGGRFGQGALFEIKP
jgi:uncharacterized repeat protein (TIGR03803 family)